MSEWTGNLPLAFYSSPKQARLLVSSRKEANEIVMYYDGYAPTYMGCGRWRLKVSSIGAGAYEIRCQEEP